MWQQAPEAAFTDVTVLDCISVWQSNSESTPLWQKVEDYVGAFEHRTTWSMQIIRKDGQHLICELVPIASGATLLRFQTQTAAHNASPRLLQNSAD